MQQIKSETLAIQKWRQRRKSFHIGLVPPDYFYSIRLLRAQVLKSFCLRQVCKTSSTKYMYSVCSLVCLRMMDQITGPKLLGKIFSKTCREQSSRMLHTQQHSIQIGVRKA